MNKWQNPDDVKSGHVYIAWVNGTILPSFWLLAKEDVWICEKSEITIPRDWIVAVHELPDPKDIGLN